MLILHNVVGHMHNVVRHTNRHNQAQTGRIKHKQAHTPIDTRVQLMAVWGTQLMWVWLVMCK